MAEGATIFSQVLPVMKQDFARMEVRSGATVVEGVFTIAGILVSYDEFVKATESELKPMRVHEGTIGTSSPPLISLELVWAESLLYSNNVRVKYAVHYHRVCHEAIRQTSLYVLVFCTAIEWLAHEDIAFAVHEPKMWDNLKANFLNHLDQVNADLKAAGLPPLDARN